MNLPKRALRPLLAVSLVACAAVSAQTPPAANTQASAFQVETVKGGLERPWSLNFAPGGQLLFTSRYSGRVSALNVASGELTRYAAGVAVRAEGEGGLLGMALDPDFASNNRLYLCYSYSAAGARKNRLSSFTLLPGGLSAEKALIDDMPGNTNHNGCRVVVSPDGFLFASMGDAAQADLAQRLDSRAGKIFRISRDGAIPNDNPFPGNPVWSLGHRNAQGLAFEPATGKLWSTEHGPNVKDELNLIEKGKNYGWPRCGGTDPCAVADYRPAVKAYTENDTLAMSNLAFYGGSAFPAWRGNLFFVTLKTGRLYRLTLDGERVRDEQVLIDNRYGRLRDVTVGPDGFLYLATDNGENSSILRLRPR